MTKQDNKFQEREINIECEKENTINKLESIKEQNESPADSETRSGDQKRSETENTSICSNSSMSSLSVYETPLCINSNDSMLVQASHTLFNSSTGKSLLCLKEEEMFEEVAHQKLFFCGHVLDYHELAQTLQVLLDGVANLKI